MNTNTPIDRPDSEHALLPALVHRMLDQQRRDLRWRNIRAVLLASAIVLVPVLYLLSIMQLVDPGSDGPYAAMVRIDGPIGSEDRLDALRINQSLTRAFDDEDARGVVLLIDSPGGTPVQSSLIYERLRSLRAEHPDTEVIAVGEDMLTSGAYFVACAADAIYVDRSTVTGSIGVISTGFGFDRLIGRHGVERRVITAGARKAQMDAYLPMAEADRSKIEAVLRGMHQHFIASVLAGRGDRLSGDPDTLFSGDYWTGEQALAMGLVDGIADLHSVIQERFGAQGIRDFSPRASLFDRLRPQIRVSLPELAGALAVPAFQMLPGQ